MKKISVEITFDEVAESVLNNIAVDSSLSESSAQEDGAFPLSASQGRNLLRPIWIHEANRYAMLLERWLTADCDASRLELSMRCSEKIAERIRSQTRYCIDCRIIAELKARAGDKGTTYAQHRSVMADDRLLVEMFNLESNSLCRC